MKQPMINAREDFHKLCSVLVVCFSHFGLTVHTFVVGQHFHTESYILSCSYMYLFIYLFIQFQRSHLFSLDSCSCTVFVFVVSPITMFSFPRSSLVSSFTNSSLSYRRSHTFQSSDLSFSLGWYRLHFLSISACLFFLSYPSSLSTQLLCVSFQFSLLFFFSLCYYSIQAASMVSLGEELKTRWIVALVLVCCRCSDLPTALSVQPHSEQVILRN